jgi:hypothetical protein
MLHGETSWPAPRRAGERNRRLGRRLHGPALALLALASACAHRTRILTQPPGASVFIADQFTCITPCMHSTPATELEDRTPLRLEREGYEPVTAELQTGYMTSRIVGGLFTLGLVPLFKWPYTYHSTHEFSLTPMSRERRLAEAERLRGDGTISEEEYQRLRSSILGVAQ